MGLGGTYKRPMPKTASRSFFWRLGMSRLLITPMGRRAVAQSVKMLTAALAYLYLSADGLYTLQFAEKPTKPPISANTSDH